MLIRNAPDLHEADITDPALYASRRSFLSGVGLSGMGLAAASLAGAGPVRMMWC